MNTIDLSADFLIGAQKLYKAWLDPIHHAAMSFGGEADIDARLGGSHSVGNGYIQGVFEELIPGQKIVQTWRTSDFLEDQADSRVEIHFSDTDEGGHIRLVQTGLPLDQVEEYRLGWLQNYFEPMKRYFGG